MNYLDNLWNLVAMKLYDEETWLAIGAGAIKIVAIVILSKILIKIAKTSIKNIFLLRARYPLRVSERREMTLLKLLQNVVAYVIYFIALIMILETLTIEVGTIIAGAGILGLAIGFGAQNLVRDVISGFFIIFEDQFSVGDYVRINQSEGHVEEIGLRITKIKSWTGELHITPNGSINEVTNFSIHNSIAVVDISIALEGDIERAEKVITEVLESMTGKYEELITTPELLGVQMLGASDVVLRVVAETLPMHHFGIARLIRKELKYALDSHGIEIPYPRLVMYSRHEKEKFSDSLNVNKEGE